jgi:mRNA interferase MazF
MSKRVKRGDVVLVPIVFSDLSAVKLRPALVIESNNFVSSYGDCLVATITSNTNRVSDVGVLILSSSPVARKAGLLQDSVILLDRITNIPLQSIRRVIGTLDDLTSVDKALRLVFAL